MKIFNMIDLINVFFFFRPQPKINIFIHEPKYIILRQRYWNHDAGPKLVQASSLDLNQ